MGDIILGDSDGVLVVSGADAGGVLENAKLLKQSERQRDDRVRNGENLCAILGLEKT